MLLDFWTYFCINCMHVIPDLKKLETKYFDALVIIGVHLAKFTTEKETDSIRAAILRDEIEHPVVNDRDSAAWKSYHIKAWPSFALIDPDGKLVGNHSGEGVFALFNLYFGQMIEAFDRKGKLDRTQLNVVAEAETGAGEGESPLSFPGKFAAYGKGRFFVADLNHHRLLAVDLLDGRVIPYHRTQAPGPG